MRIQLHTDKTRYSFLDRIRCKVTRLDDSLGVVDGHAYCGFLINGQTVYSEESDNRDLELSLQDHWDHLGSVHRIELQVELRLGSHSDRVTALSAPVFLEIDLRDISVLPTADGRPSSYVRHRDQIYFVWHGSRGHARSHRAVSADLVTAKALSGRGDFCQYLVDGQSVYRDGVRVKDLSSDGFRIHNAIFAGNAQAVLTPYGNAKVVHPSRFEVIDGAEQYMMRKQGEPGDIKAGYARDDVHGYWFCCSSSTPHATVIKACKSPDTLISLDFGYARDADHVYLEGVRIAGARPDSWSMVNRLYSRDAKSVFYLTRKVADVDLASFEVVCGSDDDDAFESILARDNKGSIKRGLRVEGG